MEWYFKMSKMKQKTRVLGMSWGNVPGSLKINTLNPAHQSPVTFDCTISISVEHPSHKEEMMIRFQHLD